MSEMPLRIVARSAAFPDERTWDELKPGVNDDNDMARSKAQYVRADVVDRVNAICAEYEAGGLCDPGRFIDEIRAALDRRDIPKDSRDFQDLLSGVPMPDTAMMRALTPRRRDPAEDR